VVRFNIKKHNLIEKNEIDVTTITRPINLHWTPEMAQDVSAFHGIDVENELTSLLSESVATEIDRGVLNNLRNMWEGMVPQRITTINMGPTRHIQRHHFTKKEETFSGILPIVRRVVATTLGLDLVSVTPMAQPTGNLFYLDYGNPTEPTVHDDGSWYHGKTFGSTLIDFVMKPHIFIKKPVTVPRRPPRRQRRRRATRLNRG
jgi:hypothetical protein